MVHWIISVNIVAMAVAVVVCSKELKSINNCIRTFTIAKILEKYNTNDGIKDETSSFPLFMNR